MRALKSLFIMLRAKRELSMRGELSRKKIVPNSIEARYLVAIILREILHFDMSKMYRFSTFSFPEKYSI